MGSLRLFSIHSTFSFHATTSFLVHKKAEYIQLSFFICVRARLYCMFFWSVSLFREYARLCIFRKIDFQTSHTIKAHRNMAVQWLHGKTINYNIITENLCRITEMCRKRPPGKIIEISKKLFAEHNIKSNVKWKMLKAIRFEGKIAVAKHSMAIVYSSHSIFICSAIAALMKRANLNWKRETWGKNERL